MPTTQDLLMGAQAIADYLGMDRRQVYHLISRGEIPSFRLGATIASRRSVLDKWLDEKLSPARPADDSPGQRVIANPPADLRWPPPIKISVFAFFP